MLGMKSRVAQSPTFVEKNVKVRILRAIYVAGTACAVGEVVTMAEGDAQCLQGSTPPTVEIVVN